MHKQALIVHTDDAASVLLQGWARREGYVPQLVRRGDEAVRLARRTHVDLIVLDRSAPDSECFDVILQLVADSRASRIPIAFVNAEADGLPIVATSRSLH